MNNKTKSVVLTQKGQINKQIKNMLDHCRFDSNSNMIYTGYYSGSGRFTSAQSALPTVKAILAAQGYKFEVGNNAPQGGIRGEYVKVSKVAFNFIASL